MQRVATPPRLAPRPPDAHKASVGKVLVVGGSRDMCGAPALCGRGALRAGAGLVRVAVPRSIQGVVAGLLPEATSAGLPETERGSLALTARAGIEEMVGAWDVLALGPGAGRDEETLHLLGEVATAIACPLVLDADGLFALGDEPERLAQHKAPVVITPHEGEAARLLGTSSRAIRADREAAATELARRSGGLAVLKGGGTIVTDGTRMFVCSAGGPHLATGGSGDVLTGVVAAFVAGLPATGKDVFGAAAAAVHVHASAGDDAARGRDRGILASDVALALPDAVARLVGPGGRE